MPSFTHESIKQDGSSSKGTLSAPDKAEAIRRLRDKGMTPINIEQREAQQRSVNADVDEDNELHQALTI